MKHRKIISVLAAVLAAVLFLSACAAPAPAEEAPAPAQATEAPAAPAATEAPAAATPAPEKDALQIETPEGLLGSLSQFVLEEVPEDDAEDLDLSALESFMSMRGGMKLEIEEVDPEELTAEQEAQMDRAMRAYVPTTEAEVINEAVDFYFYGQLNDEQKKFYDGMYLVALDPTNKDNIIQVQTKLNPRSDEFGNTFHLAQFALMYDHPELWWINIFNGGNDIDAYYGSPVDGVYTIRMQMSEPYVDFEKDVAAFNTAVGTFMEGLDTSLSQTDLALQVHDRLINLAIYDYDVMNAGGDDLAHTAFGVFVHNTAGDANHCVCDGYSLAYTYVLQQLGMEATVVSGMAGSDGSMGGHAWSIVKIDNQWYEVDSTWDDYTELKNQIEQEYEPGSTEYKVFMEMIADTAYMDRLQHYLYRIETAKIQNFIPADDLIWRSADGRYKITLVGESQRSRFCDYDRTKDSTQGALTRLLPIADGTLVPGPDSTEPAPEPTPAESTGIYGTYYVTDINGNPESALIEAWGEDYYTKLDMFDLNEDGSGTLYEKGQELQFRYTLEDGTLTLNFENGWVSMQQEGELFIFLANTGDVLTFKKR